MRRLRQSHGVEKSSERADDFQPPSGPIIGLGSEFLPEFFNGEESLYLGALKIVDLNPCVVDDLVMMAQKVEEATHVGLSTQSVRMKIASGFCRQSEETFRHPFLFIFRSSFSSYRMKIVQ
jgi:hypothetical protein